MTDEWTIAIFVDQKPYDGTMLRAVDAAAQLVVSRLEGSDDGWQLTALDGTYLAFQGLHQNIATLSGLAIEAINPTSWTYSAVQCSAVHACHMMKLVPDEQTLATAKSKGPV